MNPFKELKIWQEAMNVAIETYKVTRLFPVEERFGLVSQINRSAVSIASHIAEGAGRNNKEEFRQFLETALGSAYELKSQLMISRNLDFISETHLNKNISELTHLQNRINRLIDTLN